MTVQADAKSLLEPSLRSRRKVPRNYPAIAQPPMSGVSTTIVNLVSIEIDCPEDVLWRYILEEYCDGRKFSRNGYVVVAEAFAGYPLGSYRIRRETSDPIEDDRLCHLTELDADERRLSMLADYLSVPGSMAVYATYEVQNAAGGSRFVLTSHSSIGVPNPALIAANKIQFETGLQAYLNEVKERLEGGYEPSPSQLHESKVHSSDWPVHAEKVRTTVVNHACVKIDRPAAHVWTEILADFTKGRTFAELGYNIVPYVDPAFPLGAYRMYYESADIVDSRICLITDREEAAMRLGARAEFLSPVANGMLTYAVYQAVPVENGCLYKLDCHSTLDHSVARSATRMEVAQSIEALCRQFDEGLKGAFEKIKERIEGR